MLKRINWTLLFILLLALILRLIGLQHSFPFIFHPDEPSVVRSAMGLRFFPNPKHFDWPHLYFYLNFVVYFVFIKFRALLQTLGLQPLIQQYIPILWRDPLVFYLISRSFSAFLGALTAIPLYLTGKSLYNKTAGVFMALVVTLIPLHVWHSHYALLDVPSAFFVAWVGYFSAMIYKHREAKYYLLAGLFVGFAASTKYHGALAALTVVLVHCLVIRESRLPLVNINSQRNLFLAGLLSILGFILGTPYALFDYKTFSRTDGPIGAFWQFTNVGSVNPITHLNQFVNTYLFQLSENVGYTFLIVFVIVLIVMVVRFVPIRSRNYDVLWIYLLPFLLISFYLSGFERNRSHYYILIFPYLAIVVGYVVSKIYLRLIHNSKLKLTFVLLAIFLPPFYFSVKSTYVLTRSDTRNLLYTWMLENVQDTDILVYNSNSFVPVLEKFKDNEYTKQIVLIESQVDHGYLIMDVPVHDPSLVSSPKLNFVTWFSDHNRLGDNIFVYEINPDIKN